METNRQPAHRVIGPQEHDDQGDLRQGHLFAPPLRERRRSVPGDRSGVGIDSIWEHLESDRGGKMTVDRRTPAARHLRRREA